MDPYIANYITGVPAARRADAEFIASRQFQGLTYVDVAYLCAGVDYLFGPKGVLLPGAVTPGTGKMILSGNPKGSPYFVLHK